MIRADDFVQSIRRSELSEVKQFLELNTETKRVRDNGDSPLMISLKTLVEIEEKQQNALEIDVEKGNLENLNKLKNFQIEIYEYLVSRGINFALDEDFSKEQDVLGTSTKIQLKKIHNKFLKEASVKHVTALISKSKLSHDTPDNRRSELNQIIARSFEELNGLMWIEPILKVVSNSDNLNIIFDFGHDSVDSVDPTSNKHVLGVAYFQSGVIYIGAKKLLDENLRCEVLGHLIHELTHFAMELLYRNNSKPYTKQDKAEQERFEEIVGSCEAEKSVENIIYLVFVYTPSHRHSELIARVPHLLAHYMTKDFSEKLNEVKSTFSTLFDYFEKKTLIDLEQEYPLMESRRSVNELNELTGLSDEMKKSEILFLNEALSFQFDAGNISVVISNCVRLTMQMIYQQITNQEPRIIFMKAETLLSDKIFDQTVKALKTALKPTLIIDCERENAEDILKVFENFRLKEISKRVVFVVATETISLPGSSTFFLQHSWKELTLSTQEIFINHKVNFQGWNMPLSDILQLGSKALQTVPLQSLLTSNLRIGDEYKLYVDEVYIDRTLTEEHFENFDYYNNIRVDELVDFTNDRRIVMLSEDPGMGKSTEMKLMVNRFKTKFPSFWIIFIEMKGFVKVYERNEKISTVFENSKDSVTDFICQKILKINNFEAQVFAHLYEKNCVVFLFDGFDEISPSFKHFNKNLFKAIKENSENQFWVSTRPHLKNDLRELLSCAVIKFKEFVYQDLDDYIREAVKKENLDRSFYREKKEQVFRTMETLGLFQGTSKILNPFLVRVVLTIADDIKVSTVPVNLYMIYKTFVYRTIERFFLKGPEALRELAGFFTSSTDVMAFHQRKAVESVFITSNEDIEQSIITFFKDVEVLPTEQMARVGLLLSDDPGQLQFLHRTFEEFFVVEFFFKNFPFIVSPSSEKNRVKAIVELLRDLWLGTDSRFQVMKNFFEGLFETLLDTNNKKLQIIRKMFKENFSIDELSMILHDLTERGYLSTIKMIPFADMDKGDLRKLWLTIYKNKNVLMTAARKHSIQFNDGLIALARIALDAEDFEQMFFDEYEKGETVLSNAFENKKAFSYFMAHPIYLKGKEKTLKIIISSCEPDEDDKCLLFYALKQRKHEKTLVLIEFLRQLSDDVIKCFLLNISFNGSNILGYIAQHFIKIGDSFLRLMNEKFTKEEFKKLALSHNGIGKTPFMFAAEIKDEANFLKMWRFLEQMIDEEEFKQCLLHKSKGYITVLACAAANSSEVNFEFVLNAYKSNVEVEKIKEIMLKKKDAMDTIAYGIFSGNRKNVKVIRLLLTYMHEIFDSETFEALRLLVFSCFSRVKVHIDEESWKF